MHIPTDITEEQPKYEDVVSFSDSTYEDMAKLNSKKEQGKKDLEDRVDEMNQKIKE